MPARKETKATKELGRGKISRHQYSTREQNHNEKKASMPLLQPWDLQKNPLGRDGPACSALNLLGNIEIIVSRTLGTIHGFRGCQQLRSGRGCCDERREEGRSIRFRSSPLVPLSRRSRSSRSSRSLVSRSRSLFDRVSRLALVSICGRW